MTLYNNYFGFYKRNLWWKRSKWKKGHNPKQFKIADNELPKWLESKNDFSEAKRLINNIKINMNKNEVRKKDKKVFNGLDKLIISITNNKIEERDAV